MSSPITAHISRHARSPDGSASIRRRTQSRTGSGTRPGSTAPRRRAFASASVTAKKGCPPVTVNRSRATAGPPPATPISGSVAASGSSSSSVRAGSAREIVSGFALDAGQRLGQRCSHRAGRDEDEHRPVEVAQRRLKQRERVGGGPGARRPPTRARPQRGLERSPAPRGTAEPVPPRARRHRRAPIAGATTSGTMLGTSTSSMPAAVARSRCSVARRNASATAS